MTQEEKQLLLKDLCARLPYGVICRANEINLDGELLFINKIYNIVALYNDKATGKFDTCPIDDVKPYLRPMSSMTEEEKTKVNELIYNRESIFTSPVPVWVINESDIETYIDFCLERHLDWRGLIEKGLALEAPEGMYKNKTE